MSDTSILNLLTESIGKLNRAEQINTEKARRVDEEALALAEVRTKLHEVAVRLGFIDTKEQRDLRGASRASQALHKRNHVRRARKKWKCSQCSEPIKHRDVYFAKFLATAGDAEKVERRLHLGCVRPDDICCPEAQTQYDKAVQPFPTEQVKFPFTEGDGSTSSGTLQ